MPRALSSGAIINGMRRGQAFLALVFLLGGIVVLIGATLAFFANSFIDIGYGYQASNQAEMLANSGAQDGLLHIDRGDLTYPASYNLAVGSSTASVTISKDSPSSGYYTVLSTATVSSRTRKVNVVVAYSTTTNQTTITSWQDIQ